MMSSKQGGTYMFLTGCILLLLPIGMCIFSLRLLVLFIHFLYHIKIPPVCPLSKTITFYQAFSMKHPHTLINCSAAQPHLSSCLQCAHGEAQVIPNDFHACFSSIMMMIMANAAREYTSDHVDPLTNL